jgi:predicted MFS family arabinose efflux permease
MIRPLAEFNYQKNTQTTFNFFSGTTWDWKTIRSPTYFCFVLSQCCNAIGYLNLTTFINSFLAQQMSYSMYDITLVLAYMQASDCLGRIFMTLFADFCQKYCRFSRHLMYMTGLTGTGACMISLPYITTDNGVVMVCVAIGLFAR